MITTVWTRIGPPRVCVTPSSVPERSGSMWHKRIDSNNSRISPYHESLYIPWGRHEGRYRHTTYTRLADAMLSSTYRLGTLQSGSAHLHKATSNVRAGHLSQPLHVFPRPFLDTAR
ncbi:unnamed protein product [Alternaria burnsii]|nr:unnamed protein product [Alternaria burnsii]